MPTDTDEQRAKFGALLPCPFCGGMAQRTDVPTRGPLSLPALNGGVSRGDFHE